MIIHWEGRDYELDFSDFTLKQAEAIEAYAGMTLEEWLAALEKGSSSLKMVTIVYWLMLSQNANGAPVPPIAAVDFKLVAFSKAFAAAQAAEPAAAEEAPDPTQARPSGPTSASSPETPAPEPGPQPARGG